MDTLCKDKSKEKPLNVNLWEEEEFLILGEEITLNYTDQGPQVIIVDSCAPVNLFVLE